MLFQYGGGKVFTHTRQSFNKELCTGLPNYFHFECKSLVSGAEEFVLLP